MSPRVGRSLLLAVLGGCAAGPTTHTAAPGERPTEETPADSTPTRADSGGDTGSSTLWTLPERPDTDHPDAGASWRWGGGAGYPDGVDPTWPVVTRVRTLTELQAALGAAVAGEVVYVDDDVAIDLTGQSLCVGAGVWLASGRGTAGSPGGQLFATAGASAPILQACGADVRITGLRITGPDPETCPPEWPSRCPNDVSGDVNCAYCTDTAYAVGTTWDTLEVDNNELSGWTYAAVGVHDAVGADVHHNHIHHGWREGLGYGVVVYGQDPTSALVRWNRFDAMRHVVAGQGYDEEDYEARDNLVEDAAIGHVFDMHGEDEVAGNGSPNAGRDIRVHTNIVLVADQPSFVVRGRPTVGAWFYDNCVAPAEADATDQRYYTGNFWVDEDPTGVAAPNTWGQSAGDCGTLHWCLYDGAAGPERYGSASGTPADALLVGDLDGDGRDDVFGASAGRWRWANPDGGSWADLAASGVDVDQLALVDLDGDGVDDVFYGDGSTWRWSRGGAASWATLKSASFPTSGVGFGDFDGDGAMDVFTTEDGQWAYHPRGSGAPVELARSGADIADLGFGDFDGDGVTDVFTADGAGWSWSRSGTTSWADLATSGVRRADLALVDVDGDGVTDVVGTSGERLQVSWGGRTSWQTLRHQHESLSHLRLGDFDGDGRTDLLTGGCL